MRRPCAPSVSSRFRAPIHLPRFAVEDQDRAASLLTRETAEQTREAGCPDASSYTAPPGAAQPPSQQLDRAASSQAGSCHQNCGGVSQTKRRGAAAPDAKGWVG